MPSTKLEQKPIGSRTSAPIFKATFLRKTSNKQPLQLPISTVEDNGGEERGEGDGDGQLGYAGRRSRPDGDAYASENGSASPPSPSQPSHNSRSWPPPSSEPDHRRRGSQISITSFSPLSRDSSAGLPHPNRASLSSFASSPGSNTSNGTTIGNLSTSSMPLLAGIRDESRRPSLTTDGGNSVAPSSVSRRHADSSSVSDSSSVHSYPPAPRSRDARQMSDSSSVGSKGGSKDGALESWKNWGKDLESNGGTDKIRQEGGDEVPTTQLDPWHYLSYDSNRATPQPSPRRPSIASFLASSPSSRAAFSSCPPSTLNPLGPFRKRLARSMGAGKSVKVELQLVVELLDALDNYIAASSHSVSGDDLANGGASASLKEVTLVVDELIEVAPDAQRCLTDGLYGPLAYPSAQLKTNTKTWDDESPSWWPRRLARDCRCVLEEMEFPTGGTTSRTQLAVRPGLDVADESLEEKEEEEDRMDSVVEEGEPEEAAAVAARKAELMEQGRKRWEEWRRQSLEHEL